MRPIKCEVCETEVAVFREKFKPYEDMDWTFDVYDCPACEARFALRNPNINYHEILYTEYQQYDNYFGKSRAVKKFIAEGKLDVCGMFLKQWAQYRGVIEFVERNDPDKTLYILEVGSSTGFITAYLRARGHHVYGIDISEKAIEEAKNEFGDYFSIQPKHSTYQLIFSAGTIGCIEKPATFLQGMQQLLAPGGKFFCNAPNLKALASGEIWVSTPPPDLITIFTERTFQVIAQKLNMGLQCQQDGSVVLATTGYPLKFKAKTLAASQAKTKYPLLSIFAAKIKGILSSLRLAVTGKKQLGQYGLMVQLQKQLSEN